MMNPLAIYYIALLRIWETYPTGPSWQLVLLSNLQVTPAALGMLGAKPWDPGASDSSIIVSYWPCHAWDTWKQEAARWPEANVMNGLSLGLYSGL